MGRLEKKETRDRRYCTKCGGTVLIEHPAFGLIDVPARLLPTLAVKPTVHLNYEETELSIRDALPKLRDFPASIGGSGETLPD